VPKVGDVNFNADHLAILPDEGVNLTPFCYERWIDSQERGFCITSLANVALQHDRFLTILPPKKGLKDLKREHILPQLHTRSKEI